MPNGQKRGESRQQHLAYHYHPCNRIVVFAASVEYFKAMFELKRSTSKESECANLPGVCTQ